MSNKDLPNCGSAYELLEARQKYPLAGKINLSLQRIKEWYDHWDGMVYVSFSGGKDSTVLLHLVRSIYPDVPAVFVDTGLEYPEIKGFIRTINNVTWLKPKLSFRQVIEKYGFPVISKEVSQKVREIKTTNSEKLKNIRINGDSKGNGKLSAKWLFLTKSDFLISEKCCHIMKKDPAKRYEKTGGRKPFIGTMAADSRNRLFSILKTGCNSFKSNRPISNPISFWLEQDIWDYIHEFDVPYSRIYDMGAKRTGCIFCMFGIHLEGGTNRFQRMKLTHPKLWEYCIFNLGLKEPLDYIGVPYE